MSFCDQFHGTPRYFLDAAMRVVEDMEDLIEQGYAGDDFRADVKNMRDMVE